MTGVESVLWRRRRAEPGYEVVVYSSEGVVSRAVHVPYFFVCSPARPSLARSVVDVDSVDGLCARFDRYFLSYTVEPRLRPWRIETESAESVRHVRVGYENVCCANIRYGVRVGFDVLRMIYGVRVPIAFVDDDEERLKSLGTVSKTAENVRILVFDVEVEGRHGFPVLGDPVYSISYAVFRPSEGLHEDVTVLHGRNPTGLVEEFSRQVERIAPDLIVSYNGSGFDLPHLQSHTTGGLHYYPAQEAVRFGRRLIPHVDLMSMRKAMGPSLGVRSSTAMSLYDVARNVWNHDPDYSWLFTGKYARAEETVEHSKLKEALFKGEEWAYNYVKGDILFTGFLAVKWVPTLILLSALTGVPVNLLALNPGTIMEYLAAEWLLRRYRIFPVSRRREYEYHTVPESVASGFKWASYYTRGKVIEKAPGRYGEDGYKIVELDFAQLYPSITVHLGLDPFGLIALRRRADGRETVLSNPPFKPETVVHALLIQGGDVFEIDVAPLPGPLQILARRLYMTRIETKKLKKKDPLLRTADSAVKVLNNSFYGSFSKSEGNLVSELYSAIIFWYAQKILYDVAGFIEGTLGYTVVYGDTDSTYVLVPESVDEKELLEKVNRFIRERYGRYLYMELEGVYREMIIPKRKGEEEASGKTYIVLGPDGRIVKTKGELYKVEAPEAVRYRLEELYEYIIRENVTDWNKIKEKLREIIERTDPPLLFIKKSINGWETQGRRTRRSGRMKQLNRAFHFAGLISACEDYGAGIVEKHVEERLGGKVETVSCRVSLEALKRKAPVVIVRYLPASSRDKSRKFLVYRAVKDGRVVYDQIVVEDFEIDEKHGIYTLRFKRQRYELPRDVFALSFANRIAGSLKTILAEKLLPVLSKRNPLISSSNKNKSWWDYSGKEAGAETARTPRPPSNTGTLDHRRQRKRKTLLDYTS